MTKRSVTTFVEAERLVSKRDQMKKYFHAVILKNLSPFLHNPAKSFNSSQYKAAAFLSFSPELRFNSFHGYIVRYANYLQLLLA